MLHFFFQSCCLWSVTWCSWCAPLPLPHSTVWGREHVFHFKSCKRLGRFWMSAATYVIVSEQCLVFFSLPNLSQYHWALFKVAVSFDQTQNFMTAAEPPGLHSLAAWWGLLRQNSFRYCETQFLQWRHRLSLSAVRWLTPTALLSSSFAFLIQTNTDTLAVSRIGKGSREWQARIEVGEGQGVWVSQSPSRGSLGRPGHTVAPAGICIRFISSCKIGSSLQTSRCCQIT